MLPENNSYHMTVFLNFSAFRYLINTRKVLTCRYTKCIGSYSITISLLYRKFCSKANCQEAVEIFNGCSRAVHWLP